MGQTAEILNLIKYFFTLFWVEDGVQGSMLIPNILLLETLPIDTERKENINIEESNQGSPGGSVV